MKGISRYSVLVVYVIIFNCFFCAASVLATESDEVAIIGTVSAVGHDDKGNVIAAVFSGTGEDYQIVKSAVGKHLFKLDGMLVKAMGVVAEDSNGNKSLTVTSYEIMSQ
ncbi:MAG: hypothetical protein SWE60_20235 [Thermodesulfobacteriota bacterium]|nr:hypothetical protein [Thermodesulfobacteriota bacterium]